MKYHINQCGDLEITVSHQEQFVIKSMVNDDGFQSDDYMFEIFESLIGNSDLEWIRPEEIAALTSAPILGIVDRNDNGELIKAEQIWWFSSYQVRSPQEDLAETGMCIFQKAEVVK
jgi:hypothetical protein